MNQTLVKRIADAVLYEGYLLYPYRPSVKNRQRWTFGGLYPEAYVHANKGAGASGSQTECLVQGDAATRVTVTVRFLHLIARGVGVVDPPLTDWKEDSEPAHRPVAVLQVGDRSYHTWQEAEEREAASGGRALGEFLGTTWHRPFHFPGRRWREPLRGRSGRIEGVLVREQHAVEGAVEVTASPAAGGLYRLGVRVQNRTPLEDGEAAGRDGALLRALVSAHTVLGMESGAFVSLLDPPACWSGAAAACRNVGTWPVLVGAAGMTDTLLSSPIILPDYPEVAPESPGDFFDGTEIDEVLALRILTLTDDEKRTMAAVDERARALLARTEGLAGEAMRRLHGALRRLAPGGGGGR